MFTKDQYMPLVNKGYISRNVHPEDKNIVILNYTEKTVFERYWNDITLSCRGLILNEETGEILARPFKKFFNYGEKISNIHEALPMSTKPEITIKHDGSLGIMYRLNGKVRWATRGSFISEQSKIAQMIWDKKYSHIHVPERITLLVEIIHPQTRVVVNYNNMEDLILIGMVNRHTGIDFNHLHMEAQAIVSGINLPITKKINSNLKEILEISKKLDHNEEGFVLRWSDGYRLKVKSDKYLEVHRIIHGMSLKQKVESWANGNIDEYIKSVPEEFREEIEIVANKCKIIFENMLIKSDLFYKHAEKREIGRAHV